MILRMISLVEAPWKELELEDRRSRSYVHVWTSGRPSQGRRQVHKPAATILAFERLPVVDSGCHTSYPRSVVFHLRSIRSTFAVMKITRPTIQDKPLKLSFRLHLMTMKDLVPFGLVLRAYTAFFHCFDFSSSSVAFLFDVLFLTFGFRHNIGLRIPRIPGFVCCFSLAIGFVLSLSTSSSTSPYYVRSSPSYRTGICSIQSTVLTNSELGTNYYPCTYSMSYFVTLTLTYAHIRIHTHAHSSPPHIPSTGFVCIRICTLKDYVVAS